MAFTNYKTWSVGETLTAPNFNQQIRDNGLSMGPHLIVRKTADESVASSTTPQADNDLILPVAANEVWQFNFMLIVGGDAANDFNCRFTFPTGGDLRLSFFALNESGVASAHNFSTTTSPSGTRNLAVGSTTSAYVTYPMEGVFVNGSTAGNLALEWAQAISGVTATIMKANSTLWAVKLA